MAERASQPIPLLKTKLFVPQMQQHLVARPHLLQRLDEGIHRKLTLISAPAGFGKSTLLGAWARSGERPVAWLSLDEGDSDPHRFLAYLVAALQTISANIGHGVPGVLQSPQPPPMESTLTALLNDIVTVPDTFILVLDDYHVVDAKPVDDALTFLLEHLPPQMHLVITTREDPRLSLARLRARGQLTELRASDLRFTPSEVAEFLNQVMGLDLTADDIAALEARTEGWIAGLQLAALSLRGHQDVHGFIRAFAGDHRYIADYLVDEVLQRQSTPVRTFLLQTAILDRLYGPLCDAVTGQEDGDKWLEFLERGNFFVVPLDDQRQWYRYHHLFADVLRAHLQAEQSEQVATLHQRASAWYQRHGSLADAIRHALAGSDFSRAAELVERALLDIRRNRLVATLLGWLKALPDEEVRRRPVLSVAFATALLTSGELDRVEELLQDAERWLACTSPARLPAGMAVVDERELRSLPGLIEVYRAGHAHLLGHVSDTMTHARRALALTAEDEHIARGGAESLLALALWSDGDLESAQQHYADGMASLQRAGFVADVINSANTVAAMLVAQGRLHDAERTLQQALQRAVEHGERHPNGMADFLVGLGELRYEWNDLDAATSYLLRAQELHSTSGVALIRARWCAAMARLSEARGDLDGVLAYLSEAEQQRAPDFFPDIRPVAALRARIWIAHGQLADALGWARTQQLSVDDELSYLREYEHITLARLLLARGTSHHAAAAGLLERLLRAADAGRRIGSVIEVLVLQALLHQARGAVPAALVPLERALTLAEPEGYVRIFADVGPPMAVLLEASAKHGINPNYVRQLLTAFGTVQDSTPAQQDLIEPLSERELDVLRLLATDLDGPDIARELNVTLNTMRTHTKNIYGKLGVNNRRAAVRRAEELELLSRTRKHQSRTVNVHGT